MTDMRDGCVTFHAHDAVHAAAVGPSMDSAAEAWRRARGELDGQAGGGLNIAHEAVDRHAAGPRADHVALRVLLRHGGVEDVTYAELCDRTSRFANVLTAMGVGPGEAVFTLLGRGAAQHVAVLGALRARAVAAPLFSAFGPEPIRQRMVRGDARALVTTRALYDRKVAPVRAELPHDLVVLLTDGGAAPPVGTVDLASRLEVASAHHTIPPTDPEDRALLHFTSGTTGTPKGAIHVHEAVVLHRATARWALDLQPDDVYWCTADPGWVTGTSYGIIAPLTIGATCIVDEAEYEAERWYRTLQDQRVTVWYTAPTAIRLLMRAGADAAAPFDLSRLRVVASVGEPLNAEAVTWGRVVLGVPILDGWWQTETGGIMIANQACSPVRAGSMGRPVDGVEAAVLRQDEHGGLVLDDMGEPVRQRDGEQGELALRPGWPSMFRGYLHDDERYARCFVGGWYRSGDLVRRDADGWYWFVGRGDDVIKSAGHLIGPFEVESVLMEHPAVAEAGVIGVPDAVAGAVVKAFLVLRDGFEPSDELRSEILALARRRLGPAVAPRTVEVRAELPHTRSGKVMRRLLRARELGLPKGDLSTLEGAAS
jgi:acetyl-CoA synthetase